MNIDTSMVFIWGMVAGIALGFLSAFIGYKWAMITRRKRNENKQF